MSESQGVRTDKSGVSDWVGFSALSQVIAVALLGTVFADLLMEDLRPINQLDLMALVLSASIILILIIIAALTVRFEGKPHVARMGKMVGSFFVGLGVGVGWLSLRGWLDTLCVFWQDVGPLLVVLICCVSIICYIILSSRRDK